MTHDVAQYVALTCHGNAFFSGIPSVDFLRSLSPCQFCESVSFVRCNKRFFGGVRETVVAANPNAWFEYLCASNAMGIRLACHSETTVQHLHRMLAGFAGGNNWRLEVLLPSDQSDWWVSRWDVGRRNARDRRSRRVTYGNIGQTTTQPPRPIDLSATVHELYDSLEGIHSFAVNVGLDGFATCFRQAMETIESSGTQRHGYHQDLAPEGFLSSDASTLLDACQRAWVFGGMGSWNDLGFNGDKQRTYERVSDRLFNVLNAAIADAASSSLRVDRLTP